MRERSKRPHRSKPPLPVTASCADCSTDNGSQHHRIIVATASPLRSAPGLTSGRTTRARCRLPSERTKSETRARSAWTIHSTTRVPPPASMPHVTIARSAPEASARAYRQHDQNIGDGRQVGSDGHAPASRRLEGATARRKRRATGHRASRASESPCASPVPIRAAIAFPASP